MFIAWAEKWSAMSRVSRRARHSEPKAGAAESARLNSPSARIDALAGAATSNPSRNSPPRSPAAIGSRRRARIGPRIWCAATSHFSAARRRALVDA